MGIMDYIAFGLIGLAISYWIYGIAQDNFRIRNGLCCGCGMKMLEADLDSPNIYVTDSRWDSENRYCQVCVEAPKRFNKLGLAVILIGLFAAAYLLVLAVV